MADCFCLGKGRGRRCSPGVAGDYFTIHSSLEVIVVAAWSAASTEKRKAKIKNKYNSRFMVETTAFYDRYHQKNDRFSKVIGQGNFTYWYNLASLHQACKKGFAGLEVLDVGCGVGTISLYLAAQGADVTGIDVSRRAIQLATDARDKIGLRSVKFKQGEVNKQPHAYDVITCFEVIEHVPDEETFVKTLFANLKPGGRLVLSTPSKQNLLFKMGFYTSFDKEVGHLRRYTKERLRSVLESAGFKIISLREVEGPIRNVLFTTKLGFLIKGIRGPLVPLFQMIDEGMGRLLGFSDLQVIAQKPA